MANVDPIPPGFPRVTPYLSVDGAAKAIDFYRDILGATERMRMPAPDGKIGHAEVQIGDSVIMLADASPDHGAATPMQLGGTTVFFMVYVENADDVFKRAIAAGAKEVEPMQDRFYGDRSGTFDDPFGHRWNVATHVEDVPEDEMERRVAEMMSGG
jgi:PhnB protein